MASYSRFDALKEIYKKGRNKGGKTDNLMGKWALRELPLICTCHCSTAILIFFDVLFCLYFIRNEVDEMYFTPRYFKSLDPILKTNF